MTKKDEKKPEVEEEKAVKPGSIVLRNKIVINGKDIKVINLNMDSLRAKDLAEAEREYMMDGGAPSVPISFSFGYCLYVAAKAAKLNSTEFAEELSAKDSVSVVGRVQDFLMEVGLHQRN